jgi:hypothetical protein
MYKYWGTEIFPEPFGKCYALYISSLEKKTVKDYFTKGLFPYFEQFFSENRLLCHKFDK